jgi:hypothetical protein
MTDRNKEKSMNFPMELPKCAEHGTMELQKPGTREQAFCGTWYRCTRCTNSVLLTSPQLAAQLESQRKAA